MNFLKKNYSIIPIALIWLALVFTNYSSNTWLSGWDNLHPEFNFTLNIKRSLFSIWQEYQGLGLLGGMGHAADLFRQIFVLILSFVLPVSFLRYFFHFLVLLVGVLGVYFLAKKLIGKRGASLAGAVFYFFNLATLQMFHFPFEPYSVHYAFLPWLFLGLVDFIEKRSKKSAAIFLLVNLLATAQGYVATFFIVYFFALLFFGIVYFFQNKSSWKRILLAFFLIFLVNSFWLLPNIYFAFRNVNVNLESKINLMATNDNLLKNKKYGDLADATLLRGFWFDNVEINKEGVQSHIMGDWVGYMQKPAVKALGYFLFGLCVAGIVLALIKKQKKVWLFLPIFFISFSFLANETFVFSFFAGFLYKLPLFAQIFRFPFTKFSIMTVLCLAIFYGFFVSNICSLLKKKYAQITVFLVIAALPIIYLFPVFQGKLFYSKVQAKIPPEYFQVFDFFKGQDRKTRIANFPQSTFWGWTFYKWNYSGSGFLWYGIEQPILDRAFDVWSNFNENYYWEISYAIFSKNKDLFYKVLQKYQVNWILLDGNIINGGEYRALGMEQLELSLADTDKYQLIQTFGKIKIYKAVMGVPIENFTFVKNLPVVGPEYQWTNLDQTYLDYGNYTESSNAKPDIYYPFRSLFTGRKIDELEFVIEDLGDSFVFQAKLPKEVSGYTIEVSNYEANELPDINPNDLSQSKYYVPEVTINNGFVEVKFPKVRGYYSAEIAPVGKMESVDKTESRSFYLPNLTHDLSYLISMESRNIQGKPLLFWLENLNLRRADLEVYLPNSLQQTAYGNWQKAISGEQLAVGNFIQPPMERDGVGYTLHFDNISIGREKTINELGKVTVNLIPYNFLTKLKLVKTFPNILIPQYPNILVYSQAYDEGWHAYEIAAERQSSRAAKLLAPVFGKELKNHVLVNNWENGWVLSGNSDQGLGDSENDVIFVYLPQYLEYLGFVFLAGGLMAILLFYPSGRRQDSQNI